MKEIQVTKTRKQFNKLDDLPLYDRSLVDYKKYNDRIGHAGVKYSMAVQATRGCPYRCFYCDVYKTTLHHFRRSVDSVFEEVKMISGLGVKRIEFIDDILCARNALAVNFESSLLQRLVEIIFSSDIHLL